MLQLKADRENYKAILEENPHGTFSFNLEEGCIHQETIGSHKADFMCFGRCGNLSFLCQYYDNVLQCSLEHYNHYTLHKNT